MHIGPATRFLLDTDVQEIVSHLPIGALDQFAGKHVLITGGRGFLGRYFTAVFSRLNSTHLLDKPVRVTCMDNLISAGPAGADVTEFADDPNIRFVNHNVIFPIVPTPVQIEDGAWVPEPADFILHAAGIASPAHYRKYPLETMEVAITGLKNALELARANPGCKLSFFSSSEIYGDPDEANVPTTEAYRGNVACLGPRSCYDSSKRMGEGLVQIYVEQHGVHATIIRPFNVYGPGMQATDYRVLPNFAAKIALGEPLEVYGDGNQTRTYCYVADAIGGFLRVLLHGRAGEPYNIGYGDPKAEVSVLGLARAVDGLGEMLPVSREGHMHSANLLGLSRLAVHVKPHPPSYPADEPSRRCPDISKASRELGYAPRIALEDGLRRFFGWALAVYPKATVAPRFTAADAAPEVGA